MARMSVRASANEMLDVLNKQWLDTKDIKLLASVGIEKARKIKNEIISTLEDDNYFLPSGLVPSEKVVEYLNLNVKYLKKIAKDSEVQKHEKN